MSVNYRLPEKAPSHKVVRKNLLSMHEDLSNWSHILQDSLPTDSGVQTNAMSSIHQQINTFSNKYRPLSMSFQQWQTSKEVERDSKIIESAVTQDFNIHKALQVLALQLQFVSNLELQLTEDDESGVHVHGNQQLKNEIEKLLFSSPNRISSEESIDDPFSAKLDNILEDEEDSVISSIEGSETISNASIVAEDNVSVKSESHIEDEVMKHVDQNVQGNAEQTKALSFITHLESTSVDDRYNIEDSANARPPQQADEDNSLPLKIDEEPVAASPLGRYFSFNSTEEHQVAPVEESEVFVKDSSTENVMSVSTSESISESQTVFIEKEIVTSVVEIATITHIATSNTVKEAKEEENVVLSEEGAVHQMGSSTAIAESCEVSQSASFIHVADSKEDEIKYSQSLNESVDDSTSIASESQQAIEVIESEFSMIGDKDHNESTDNADLEERELEITPEESPSILSQMEEYQDFQEERTQDQSLTICENVYLKTDTTIRKDSAGSSEFVDEQVVLPDANIAVNVENSCDDEAPCHSPNEVAVQEKLGISIVEVSEVKEQSATSSEDGDAASCDGTVGVQYKGANQSDVIENKNTIFIDSSVAVNDFDISFQSVPNIVDEPFATVKQLPDHAGEISSLEKKLPYSEEPVVCGVSAELDSKQEEVDAFTAISSSNAVDMTKSIEKPVSARIAPDNHDFEHKTEVGESLNETSVEKKQTLHKVVVVERLLLSSPKYSNQRHANKGILVEEACVPDVGDEEDVNTSVKLLYVEEPKTSSTSGSEVAISDLCALEETVHTDQVPMLSDHPAEEIKNGVGDSSDRMSTDVEDLAIAQEVVKFENAKQTSFENQDQPQLQNEIEKEKCDFENKASISHEVVTVKQELSECMQSSIICVEDKYDFKSVKGDHENRSPSPALVAEEQHSLPTFDKISAPLDIEKVQDKRDEEHAHALTFLSASSTSVEERKVALFSTAVVDKRVVNENEIMKTTDTVTESSVAEQPMVGNESGKDSKSVPFGTSAANIARRSKVLFEQRKSKFECNSDATAEQQKVTSHRFTGLKISPKIKKLQSFGSTSSTDDEISTETRKVVTTLETSVKASKITTSKQFSTENNAKSPESSLFTAQPFKFSSNKTGHVASSKKAVTFMPAAFKKTESHGSSMSSQTPSDSSSQVHLQKPPVPAKPKISPKPKISSTSPISVKPIAAFKPNVVTSPTNISSQGNSSPSIPLSIIPKPWNSNMPSNSETEAPIVPKLPDANVLADTDRRPNVVKHIQSPTSVNPPLVPPVPHEDTLKEIFSDKGTLKPSSEDFVSPPLPPPPSDAVYTSRAHFKVTSPTFRTEKKPQTQEASWKSPNDDLPLPPPPSDLPMSPPPSNLPMSSPPSNFHVSSPPSTSPSFFQSEKPKGFRSVARPVLKKPANSSRGKETTQNTYSMQGDPLPPPPSADTLVTPKERLPEGAVYQTTSKDGDVVHTDTYYPATDQSDPKTVVLERTKTTTIVQAPHHQGIGPTTDSGVPYALRSTVDDSKHWYKNMFKQMHKVGNEDESSQRSANGRPHSAASGDGSYRHTSAGISKPTKVGRITDYQPADPYVVENKPDPVSSTTSHTSSSLKSPPASATVKSCSAPYSSNVKASMPVSGTKRMTNSTNKGPAKPQAQKEDEMRLPARAKFDFVPQTAKEYAMKRGQTVIITKQVDNNWYMVQSVDGVRGGIVPVTYVEAVSGASPEKPRRNGQARAKFDFAGSTKSELSFKKGDDVVLLKRIDDNWYKGKLGGKTGILPVAYVEVTMEPEEEAPKENPLLKQISPPAPKNNASHSHQSSNLSQASSDEPDEKERKQRAAFLAQTVVGSKAALHSREHSAHREDLLDVDPEPKVVQAPVVKEKAPPAAEHKSSSIQAEEILNFTDLDQAVKALSTEDSQNYLPPPSQTASYPSSTRLTPPSSIVTPSIPSYPSSNISTQPSSPHLSTPPINDYGQVIGCYVTLYAYEASNEDELDLQPGDLVMVVETCDDGWYVGTCQRTGAFGTFPGNYVSLTNTT